MPSRKAMPSADPPAAGSQPAIPWLSASSMAGISSDQTDAAIITPAANPMKIRCIFTLSRWRRSKKTMAEPNVVIKKVKPVPNAAHKMVSFIVSLVSLAGSV